MSKRKQQIAEEKLQEIINNNFKDEYFDEIMSLTTAYCSAVKFLFKQSKMPEPLKELFQFGLVRFVGGMLSGEISKSELEKGTEENEDKTTI